MFAKRPIDASSKRRRSYSKAPSQPSPSPSRKSVRSNFAVAVSTGIGSRVAPSRENDGTPASVATKSVVTIGARSADRPSTAAETISSNGSMPWPTAARNVAPTRRT